MASLPLIIADAADLLLGTLLAPQWGVFLNGVPVIQPASIGGQVISGALGPIQQIASLLGAPNLLPVQASTVEFSYSNDNPLSNYPQEQGAFQSYDKVALPFDVKIKLAASGSAAQRQAYLNTCLAIQASLSLFDIVTPELVFTSCNCSHMDFKRTALNGVTLIVVDLWFQQIAITSATSFTSTQQPGDSGRQALGNVQPQVPSTAIANGFASGAFKVQ